MKKRPTMTDIAREAGVSKNTVSLALRNDPQIPPHTRERIEKIATALGYQKNPTIARLMAQLRSAQNASYRAPLGLLNANEDPMAFKNHPTIPTYIAGCRSRAKQLGYSFDEFWLHDPELDGTRLNRILKARGILGTLVVGLMGSNRLPERFNPTWEHYPTIVTGVRTRKPALSFACVDHHMLALRAFEKAIELGYQRPAMVLDKTIDELVNGRFTAGALIAQRELPRDQRTNFYYNLTDARQDRHHLGAWLHAEKPDVIITLYHEVKRWLIELRYEIPKDIGLIQLEWRKDHSDWAGMNQHNDLTGSAAIDMLVGMVHSNDSTMPKYPRGTLIASSWVHGHSIQTANRVGE